MKVLRRQTNQVPVSEIADGGAFLSGGQCFIRVCAVAAARLEIEAVNLENGSVLVQSRSRLVEPVDVEARVL